jgi:hypothetical protein
VGAAGEHPQEHERLVTVVRLQADQTECWQRAETVLRAGELRDRLQQVGVEATSDVATALMAAAMLLASGSEEWGGDYRDALADLAALGLELLESRSP